MRLAASALACLIPIAASSQTPAPDAATIMARVAANQDRSEAERAHFIYVQHAKVSSRKGKTIRCEEITDSRVIPSESGSSQQLLSLDGRLLDKHNKYTTYTQLPASEKAGSDDADINIGGESTDRDLVENMRHNLTNTKTKDGIGAGLFPLTSKSQAGYEFHLLSTERINGREVFHLTFAPKDKSEFAWKGDAYIDTTAFQPVLVRTAMSRNIPFAVRTLLGTSVPGLGFTVIYAPEPEKLTPDHPEPVWFPTSFGTEFKLKVLFFFSREITISAQNRDFQRTHVDSTILPAQPSDQPPAQP